ncbi:hypothetical protein ACX801_20390 [Arthrobacter bambusae]
MRRRHGFCAGPGEVELKGLLVGVQALLSGAHQGCHPSVVVGRAEMLKDPADPGTLLSGDDLCLNCANTPVPQSPVQSGVWLADISDGDPRPLEDHDQLRRISTTTKRSGHRK